MGPEREKGAGRRRGKGRAKSIRGDLGPRGVVEKGRTSREELGEGRGAETCGERDEGRGQRGKARRGDAAGEETPNEGAGRRRGTGPGERRCVGERRSKAGG